MFIKKNGNFSDKAIIMVFALLLFSTIISCKDKGMATHRHNQSDIGIVLIDKTIMRTDPIIYSSLVAYIDKGERVVILGRSKEKESFGHNENYWYNVRFSRGFFGWIYGNNIKIFSASKTREIEKFLAAFWETEMEKLRKKLAGKWGSMELGALPGQSLEIFDDGKYKSYRMGSDAIEGEYSINFKEGEIIFKNGTYFGKSIAYSASGNAYFLKKANKDNSIKFKKVSSKINNAGDDAKKDNRSGA